jgi:hypothetical protein
VACPADAGTFDADAGTGCVIPMAGRATLSGQRLYVGDQNGGRVFVLELAGDQLVERRGYAGDAGAPLQMCPVDPVLGFGNVSDLLRVP